MFTFIHKLILSEGKILFVRGLHASMLYNYMYIVQ